MCWPAPDELQASSQYHHQPSQPRLQACEWRYHTESDPPALVACQVSLQKTDDLASSTHLNFLPVWGEWDIMKLLCAQEVLWTSRLWKNNYDSFQPLDDSSLGNISKQHLWNYLEIIKIVCSSLNFKNCVIIFINTIVISAIITLIWQVGKYVFLFHFRDANRPMEAECLINGNSFHDFRPWYRIISPFNLSSSSGKSAQGVMIRDMRETDC